MKEAHHPIVTTNPEIIFQFESDSDESDGGAEFDEYTTNKFTPEELADVIADISILPDYKINRLSVERFIGLPERITTAEFNKLRVFTLNTGQTFECGALLGQGGQAKVYEAHPEPLQLNVYGAVTNAGNAQEYQSAVLKISRVPPPPWGDIRNIYREILAGTEKKSNPLDILDQRIKQLNRVKSDIEQAKNSNELVRLSEINETLKNLHQIAAYVEATNTLQELNKRVYILKAEAAAADREGKKDQVAIIKQSRIPDIQKKIEQIQNVMKPLTADQQKIIQSINIDAPGLSLIGVKHYITEKDESIFVTVLERGHGYDLETIRNGNEFAERQKSSYFRLELMEGMLACLRQLNVLSSTDRGQWIHGDIKPANILLHGKWSSLIDWGMAYRSHDSTMDQNPFFMRGTPSYISPDAYRRSRIQRNQDWYSLGVTFAEVLGTMTFSQEQSNIKQIYNSILSHGSPLTSDILAAKDYHGKLRKQLELSPERDFAWLCYRLAQPHCKPGEYKPYFNTYDDIIDELTDTITRQRLRLRTKKLRSDVEGFMFSNMQLGGNSVYKKEISKLLGELDSALVSDDDNKINSAASKTKEYLREIRQTFNDERPSVKRVRLAAEKKDHQEAQFRSLRSLVISLMTLLIQRYTYADQTIQTDFNRHLMEGIELAECRFADGEPEVGFGILHLMQQDLSRLQLAQERGEELRLRYYDYDALIKEFTFSEAEGNIEERTTDEIAA